MKILLAFVLTILSTVTSAADMSSISLITPATYKKPAKFPQTFTSKVIANGASKLDIKNYFDTTIHKIVKSTIEPKKKELDKYFPKSGELDALVTNTVQGGINTQLNVINDKGFINFFRYIGKNLIGEIANRILEVEGVKDPERRKLWVDKMNEPFNACIDSSQNFLFDARHCLTSLTENLQPDVGVGIVFELSRSSLSSALPEDERTPFNEAQANAYKKCMGKAAANKLNEMVMPCALSTMKNGVSKVTDSSLSKTIFEKASTEENGTAIKNSVWPTFNGCVQKVGADSSSKSTYTDQFMGCIDSLIIETGSQLVVDKISNTESIKSAIAAKELETLAAEKSEQFKKCAKDLKARGIRSKGMLDISLCEGTLTNDVTYRVVSITLKNTAASKLKNNKDKALANSIGEKGVKTLDQCWNSKQSAKDREACIRKTIVSFAQQIAQIKLDESIPNDYSSKKDLMLSSSKELGSCIDRELPENISESNELTKKLDDCTGKLTKTVALKVAAFQIRSAAGDNVSPADTDKLIKKLVDHDFAACIGNLPTDDQLEQCIDSLTKKSGKTISEMSFSKEVNSYLAKAGGIKTLGITQSYVDSFLNELNKSTGLCIDKKSTLVGMDLVNSCIKESIKKIALFMGDVQFNKSVGKMYDGREADKKEVQDQFKKSLGDCLSTKDGKAFTISDFTKNLYTCSDKISSSTTQAIGIDQVNTSLDTYLKDRPNMNIQKIRDAIRAEVIGNFKKCMSKGSDQPKCIDSLKKEATSLIVLNYGQVETKFQLNASETPSELKPIEDELVRCSTSKLEGEALSEHLDLCTKNFALGFAKALGALKLKYLLMQALGSDEFNKQKKDIEGSLEKYNACLKDLERYNMSNGLTDKLSVCTDGLTNRGMAIVRSNINNWMTSEQKDAATVMLKTEFSNFLPCLAALLPASPYNQNLKGNVESTVKPLAVLLAHYIEYNPENAKDTLEGVMSKLAVDFNDVAQTTKAKKELLDFLIDHDGLDQFLKAIVRGTVKDALIGISDKDVPNDLRTILLNRENFEEIFNSPGGIKVKDMVVERMLKPFLLGTADAKSPDYTASMEVIKENVIKLLIDSPKFGEQAIKLSVQKQINDMGGVTKFFAKALYGGDSLQWDKVRMSPEGKKAEEFIKTQILMPKFKGTIQSSAEQKKAYEEAEKLVKKAVKSYG